METRSAIFLFVLLAACREPADHAPRDAAPAASEPTQLVIASYNVFYGNGERTAGPLTTWGDAETLRVVAGLGADVIALQETNAGWAGAIEATLRGDLDHCRFHEPKRFLPGGIGLCSRYPIVEDELVASPVDWFPAQRVTLQHPRGLVDVLNVHLKPAVADAGAWWAVHRATRADRVKEMEGLLKELAPGRPAIVLGDFNEVLEGEVFALLRQHGLTAAFAEAPTEHVSWSWAGAEPPLAALLDHVVYDRSAFTLVSAAVVPGGRSDHQAVSATLRW